MSENLQCMPEKIIFVFDDFSEFEIPGEYLFGIELSGVAPVKTEWAEKNFVLTFNSFRCDVKPNYYPDVFNACSQDTGCDFITYMEKLNNIAQIIVSENDGETIPYYVGDNYQQDYMVSNEGTCILIEEK